MSYPFPVNSSGSLSASAQIITLPAFLAGIDMLSPSTGTALLMVYDSENSTTSGRVVLAEMEVDAGMPSCNHEYSAFVTANRGLYVTLSDLSGTARFIIRFGLG